MTYPRLGRKKGLYLKDTPKKGRGVFCDGDIRKGEVIETTPALVLNEKSTATVDKTLLGNYTFSVGKMSKKIQERKGVRRFEHASCVIMGVISFCNHAEEPNAEVEWEEKKGTLYHTLKALKRIPKNTEICTSYGDGWFESHGRRKA